MKRFLQKWKNWEENKNKSNENEGRGKKETNEEKIEI